VKASFITGIAKNIYIGLKFFAKTKDMFYREGKYRDPKSRKMSRHSWQRVATDAEAGGS
jgi:hypothetical protein